MKTLTLRDSRKEALEKSYIDERKKGEKKRQMKADYTTCIFRQSVRNRDRPIQRERERERERESEREEGRRGGG